MDNTELLETIRTSQDAKRLGIPVFKIFSDDVVELYEEKDAAGQTVKKFKLTASSNGADLVGDVMSNKALASMESAAPGTTVFLNHKYSVPEDVFGRVTRAALVKRAMVPEDSSAPEEMLCLDFEGDVETSNPRAVQTSSYIQKGTKLGASVTVLVLDRSDAKSGHSIIEDVKYLEVSIVGIPCNRQSWVQSASKALRIADEHDAEEAAKTVQADPPAAAPAVLSTETPSGQALVRENITKDAAGCEADSAAAGQLAKAVDEAVGRALGHTTLPLAPIATPWEPAAAKSRMAGKAKKPGEAYKRGHLFFDSSKPERFTSYALPFADMVDGKQQAIPRAIFAAAGVLQAELGAVKGMPEQERERARARVSRYYARMRQELGDETLVAPWEKSSSFSGREMFWSQVLVRQVPAIKVEACEKCGPASDLVVKAQPLFADTGEWRGYSFTCECKSAWERTSAELAEKGMFNQELDERGLPSCLLYDVFCECLWKLYREVYYEDMDKAAAQKELVVVIKEYAAALQENAPKWIGLYEAEAASKEAGVSIETLGFLAELASKAGARHSAADREMIQQIHNLSIDLGGQCPESKSLSLEESEVGYLKQTAALLKSHPGTAGLASKLETLAEGATLHTAGSPGGDPKVAELTQQLEAANKKAEAAELRATTAEQSLVKASADRDSWKAAAWSSAVMLAKVGERTLPRAGSR